jgi:hypothetical protein
VHFDPHWSSRYSSRKCLLGTLLPRAWHPGTSLPFSLTRSVDSVSFRVDLMLYDRMHFRLCLNLKICVCFIWICGLFFEIVRFLVRSVLYRCRFDNFKLDFRFFVEFSFAYNRSVSFYCRFDLIC